MNFLLFNLRDMSSFSFILFPILLGPNLGGGGRKVKTMSSLNSSQVFTVVVNCPEGKAVHRNSLTRYIDKGAEKTLHDLVVGELSRLLIDRDHDILRSVGENQVQGVNSSSRFRHQLGKEIRLQKKRQSPIS